MSARKRGKDMLNPLGDFSSDAELLPGFIATLDKILMRLTCGEWFSD